MPALFTRMPGVPSSAATFAIAASTAARSVMSSSCDANRRALGREAVEETGVARDIKGGDRRAGAGEGADVLAAQPA